MSSLPIPLANFTSNQLAFTKIYFSTKTIAPDSLILLISEEYERQHAQHTHRSGPGKAKDEDWDKALAVIPEKSKGKERKPHGVCWNCGEKGHFKNKCPKPAVKKDNSPKKTGAANAVVESDSDAKGAFFMEDSDSDDPDMPDLRDFSDSESKDEGSVWFTDIEDEVKSSSWESEELSGVDWARPARLSMLTWTWKLLIGIKSPVHRTRKKPDWDQTGPEKTGLSVAVRPFHEKENWKKTDETEPVWTGPV